MCGETQKIRVCIVAGARPNFMKIAPLIRALKQKSHVFSWNLVHTGQHYDHGMSEVFFRELGIPEPDHHLGAGGGSHAHQTARIMVGFEDYCMGQRPDIVLVVGDVDSTLACSVVAKKLRIQLAHVEAGLRSGDRDMPEEINRIVTDSISDYFFVTEESGLQNLLSEGHPNERIFFVGHVMVDNLFYQYESLKRLDTSTFDTDSLRKSLGRYGVVTMHRPSNVDNPDVLKGIVRALNEIAEEIPLVFPVHPRTATSLERFKIELHARIAQLPPLPYMEFLNLWSNASVILTDSGGLQEESTALGVPCITLRETTERPVTVHEGTNRLAGTDRETIVNLAKSAISSTETVRARKPKFWDGDAAQRIVLELEKIGAKMLSN